MNLALRSALACALALACSQAPAAPAEQNVYQREPLNAGRAQHARVVLSVYAPTIAFYDSIGAEPRKRLTPADLSELFASVAFSSMGCSAPDASCETKARRAGSASAKRALAAKDIGSGIQTELARLGPGKP